MIPLEKELVEYLKKNDLVNYSDIARHFNIKNTTVSDLIDTYIKKKIVEVKKLGGSKVVRLKR